MRLVSKVLQNASAQLAASSSPCLDAELLLAYALKKERSYLYAYPEKELKEEEFDYFTSLLKQRQQGKPLAYITGRKEFWSLSLEVTEATLIPRPETEELVSLCLQSLAHKAQAKILELGTGSGAIALALAKERPDWQIQAVDNSVDALEVARKNAHNLDLPNVDFYYSDWFSAVGLEKFDAILSNPPYIAKNDGHLAQPELIFEPRSALTDEKDGLSALRHIIENSLPYLQSQGLVIVEHGYNQKHIIASIMKRKGFKNIQSMKDIFGNNRISQGVWY